MDDHLKSYRDHLVQADQKSVEAFDKNLLGLSGGALGISLVFIKGIAPAPIDCGCLLIVAWVCWVTTISTTLCSFYVSHLALRKAIRQIDNETIYKENPGGTLTTITHVCNVVSGALFLVGVVLFLILTPPSELSDTGHLRAVQRNLLWKQDLCEVSLAFFGVTW